MVDVSVTATEVLDASDTVVTNGHFGETVTAGQVVYKKASDGLFWLADADDTSATATVAGIAMNGGAAGQPAEIAIGRTIDPGFTVTVGEIYVLSGTPGGIAPVADLASGDYVSIIGIGITASSLSLEPLYNSGVQVP